jgi:hypothetical protein
MEGYRFKALEMSAFVRPWTVFPDSINIFKLLGVLFAQVPFISNNCSSETLD